MINIVIKDRVGKARLILRLGLAVIFLFAAISSLLSPQEWIGYFPKILTDLVPSGLLLKGFSGYETVLALWLLSGKYTQYAAILAALTLGGIVVSNFSLFIISFRDIALIFAAVSLAILSFEG